MNYEGSKNRSIILRIIVFLSGLSTLVAMNGADKLKPTNCEGTLVVKPEIKKFVTVLSNPYIQPIGNLSYSLAMNGTLSLASLSSPSFNCSAIINQIKSSSSMRTLESVYASGQIHCESDYTDIDSSWLTRYTQVRFSGNLYISIIVHDGVCAGPPVLLTRDSTCDFQVKAEENMNNTGKCDWTLENSVHHMGDQDPNQSGGDGE